MCEHRGRCIHAEKLVETCMERQQGNSNVGNTEAGISTGRKICRFSTVGTGTGGSICAPQYIMYYFLFEAVNFICDHPDIRAISFVGSNQAGEYIYERGSRNGKRVQANMVMPLNGAHFST